MDGRGWGRQILRRVEWLMMECEIKRKRKMATLLAACFLQECKEMEAFVREVEPMCKRVSS